MNAVPTLALEKNLLLLGVDLAVIVLAARLFGAVLRRLGQPQVIGEILAGIVLGPTVLGRIFPQALATLLPPAVSSVLAAVANVGLILLMLLIGLAFPFDQMGKVLRLSLPVAVAGLALPFGLSYALAGKLFPLLGAGGSPIVFQLFFATALSITALPVMGRILLETRLARTRMGLVAMGAAAIDDVLGWIVLGGVVATATRGKTGAFPMLAALSEVAALSLLFWSAGRFAVARVRITRNGRGGLPGGPLAMALAAAFAAAAIASAAGVFAAFGGFLCGVAVSFHPELREGLKTSIEDLVMVLLVPVFFLFSGLRTDLGSLGSDPRLWGALAVTLLVACATKFGGAALAARTAGLPWREAGAVGALMNTRGLMALVVINVGADLGVVSPPLFFILVSVALLTTLIATPVLRRLHPRGREPGWAEQRQAEDRIAGR